MNLQRKGQPCYQGKLPGPSRITVAYCHSIDCFLWTHTGIPFTLINRSSALVTSCKKLLSTPSMFYIQTPNSEPTLALAPTWWGTQKIESMMIGNSLSQLRKFVSCFGSLYHHKLPGYLPGGMLSFFWCPPSQLWYAELTFLTSPLHYTYLLTKIVSFIDKFGAASMFSLSVSSRKNWRPN